MLAPPEGWRPHLGEILYPPQDNNNSLANFLGGASLLFGKMFAENRIKRKEIGPRVPSATVTCSS